MLPEGFILGKSMEGITFLRKSIRPPPCFILSSLYGGVNPSKINFLRGNVSSNFFLDISKISILLRITSFSISNLFHIELIFRHCTKNEVKFFNKVLITWKISALGWNSDQGSIRAEISFHDIAEINCFLFSYYMIKFSVQGWVYSRAGIFSSVFEGRAETSARGWK